MSMRLPVKLLQALANPTRLRVLNLLMQTREVCVCEMVDALQTAQYNVSRHLHALREADLLEDRRSGKWIYYRVKRNLTPYQRALLRAVAQLREESDEFRNDEVRAARRLKLRRDGLCCVGLVQNIGAALVRKNQQGSSARVRADARR